MSVTHTRDQGKSSFVKEYLHDHPQSNPTAVNEAWKSAGMHGTISTSLINNIRGKLGLSGNLRAGRPPKNRSAKKPGRVGRPSKKVVETPAPQASSRLPRPDRQVRELEAEIDRLLFKVMNATGLETVEECLRDARRALYHSQGSR